MTSIWEQLPDVVDFPILDLLAAFIWLWMAWLPWRGYAPPPELIAPEERALGASVIMGQLGAIITGSSIILAAIAAFVSLGRDGLTEVNSSHLRYSTYWAVTGLGIALYTTSVLPARTFKRNFAAEGLIAIFCAMALFFTLAAAFRLLLAVRTFLMISVT